LKNETKNRLGINQLQIQREFIDENGGGFEKRS